MNLLTATLLTLVLTCPVFASGPPSYWSEDLSGAQAVAGTPAGALATARAGEKELTSVLNFRLPAETGDRSLEIKGQVRSLIFIEDGAALLAVVQKQFRKKSWDTFLLKIDTATSKTTRLVTLPRSAAGMTLLPGARHLLVACNREIRSFTLPGFRSGQLYRLPGGNLALAHYSGPLILVGRTHDLVLVNLEDPPGEEQMPIRQRFAIASPLRSMTISADATRLYGVTLDGVKVEQSLDAMDLSAAVLPQLPAVPEPEAIKAPVEVVRPPVRKTVVPPEPQPDAEPQAQADATDFQLFGTLQGAAASRVESVLILGPNNILREAARVRPDADGRWGVAALPPGRYRIVLDGGGGHVIVSEPRFAAIQVIEGEAVEAPPFDVQRIR